MWQNWNGMLAMNNRYYFDQERGLVTIQRSPNAHRYPTVDEVKAWMGSGSAPSRFDDEEPERCDTCGRASDCACPGCQCNASLRGTVQSPCFRRRTDPTGTENGRAE